MEKGLNAEDCCFLVIHRKKFDMRLAVSNLGLLHELLQCSSVCVFVLSCFFLFKVLSSVQWCGPFIFINNLAY